MADKAHHIARLARIAIAVVLVVAWLVPSAVTSADTSETIIRDLSLPSHAVTGDPIVVTARLVLADGTPVVGQPLGLYQSLEFMSIAGEIRLAIAVTNADGLAAFEFDSGTDGPSLLTARFAGNATLAESSASETLNLEIGASTYREESGIRVPGVGVWLLAALLCAIWGTFLFVMYLVGRIEAAGRRFEAAGSKPDV